MLSLRTIAIELGFDCIKNIKYFLSKTYFSKKFKNIFGDFGKIKNAWNWFIAAGNLGGG